MADDLNTSGSKERVRVDINSTQDVTYWCRLLNCTEDELRVAVSSVGVMAEAVKPKVNFLKMGRTLQKS